MHKALGLILIFCLSPQAFAQKAKLKCAVKPPTAKSCTLQKNTTAGLADEAAKIKEVCAKDEFSEEYLEAYMLISSVTSFERVFNDRQESIKHSNEALAKSKSVLEKMLAGQYKEQSLLAKKYQDGWKKIAQLKKTGNKKLIEIELEKVAEIEDKFTEKFGDDDAIHLGSTPNELKLQIKKTEKELQHLQKQQDILTKMKESLDGLENKENQNRAIISTHINMKVEDIKKRKTFTDCGLSPQEIHAILLYTAEHYGTLNRALRENSEVELSKYQPIIDAINSGLSKLQSQKGMVKRGADLPKEIEEMHCKGCIVTYDAYTSTSIEDGFEGSAMFVIQSKNGKYVAPLSDNANEEEVLFAPGAKFKILNVKKIPDGKQFTMSEQ